MRTRTILAAAILVPALAACGSSQPPPSTPQPAQSATPSSVTTVNDLVGQPVSIGEAELSRRGYSVVNSQGRTTYWSNRTRGTCVRVLASQGTFSEVETTPPSFCAR